MKSQSGPRALRLEHLEGRAMMAGNIFQQATAALRQLSADGALAQQQIDNSYAASQRRLAISQDAIFNALADNSKEITAASTGIAATQQNLATQGQADILDLVRSGKYLEIPARAQKLAEDQKNAALSSAENVKKEVQDQTDIAGQMSEVQQAKADEARAYAEATAKNAQVRNEGLREIITDLRQAMNNGGDIPADQIANTADAKRDAVISELNGKLANSEAKASQASAVAGSKVGTKGLFGSFDGEQDDNAPNQRITSHGSMTANVDLYPDNQILGSFRVSGLTLKRADGSQVSVVDITGTIRGTYSTTPGVLSKGTLEYSIQGSPVVLNWIESPPVYKITVDANRKITGFGAKFTSDQAHTVGSFALMLGPQ